MGKIVGLLMVPEALTHLTGANNYTWLHFWNGEKQMVAKTLRLLETDLPSFIRIHKTVLVNPSYITELQPPPGYKKSGTMSLYNGLQLPISRRRWTEVAEQMVQMAGLSIFSE